MGFLTVITDPGAAAGLIARLNTLTPESQGQWGRMSAHGMLCHVADVGFGLTTRFEGARPRQHLRVIYALHLPVSWPKGIRTPKVVDQEHGGTRPAEFEADRSRAIASLHAMAAVPDGAWPAFHPLLGPLSDWEWRRFGWKHTDHHLRQFGL